jgi:hypothetical protein
MELNGLAVKLQNECNPESCPQMTATEQWIFLCAAHKTPKEVLLTFEIHFDCPNIHVHSALLLITHVTH